MKKVFKELDSIIYILLLCYTFVDCLTGLFKMYGLPSVSLPYKVMLICLMVVSLKSYSGGVIYFYYFAIILSSLCLYLFNAYTSIFDSLAMQLRIIMAPIVFIYLKKIYLYNIIKIITLLKVNTMVLVFNLLLGGFGFGDSTYKGQLNLGVKGFFYDGNALAVTLFVIYVIWLNLLPQKKIKVSITFFVLAVLIATKVSVLSVLFYFCCFCFLDVPMKKRFSVLGVLFIGVFLLSFFLFQMPIFQYHYERIKWLLTIFDGNYLSALLSGRDIDLAKHYSFFQRQFSLTVVLFGYGYLNFMKIIELDAFDTLFCYGVLFFIPTFLFYSHCLFINRRNLKIVMFNVVYFLISITSGHVWYNSQAALFFVIINLIFLNGGGELIEKNFDAFKHVSIKFKTYLRCFCKTNL